MSGDSDSAAGRMPGFPGMGGLGGFPGMPGLDPEALNAMMQDPGIQRMMQAVAQDPTFMEMARQMQDSLLSGGLGGLNLGGEGGDDSEAAAPRAAPGGLPGGAAGLDPTQYMQAMDRLMSNPEFLAAANSLGKRILDNSVMGADTPEAATMVRLMGNPEGQSVLKAKMEGLKEDPEVRDIIAEIEAGGQGAMMKYMQDPETMAKLGRKFQEVMQDPELQALVGGEAGAEAAAGGEGEAAEEEAEEEITIFSLASQGDAAALREFLSTEGVQPDERDEEGRTALHFASGYGELECMRVLLAAGADANARDDNQNTALHYAAGYGNVESATALLESGADASARNAEGKTAAEVAEMNEQSEVAEALRTAEAKKA